MGICSIALNLGNQYPYLMLDSCRLIPKSSGRYISLFRFSKAWQITIIHTYLHVYVIA